jgi:hypothetical protein
MYLCVFVERSSTKERCCHPPPKKKKIGNDCHTQVHAKNAKAKTLFDNLKVKKISFEKYLQILVI